MASIQGNLVRAYLYKAVWTLTFSGAGFYILRVNGTNTSAIEIGVGNSVSQVQTALDAILGASNSVVSGTDDVSPYTITLAGDYVFSGVPFEVASTTGTAAVTISRTFPGTIPVTSEANGFYKLGVETSLDKNMEIESQDVTSKDSAGWRETKSQIRQVGLSAQNFFATEYNYDKIKKQFELLQPIIICDTDPVQSGGSQILNFGVYVINNLSHNATFNQNVEFTADFQLVGKPTQVLT